MDRESGSDHLEHRCLAVSIEYPRMQCHASRCPVKIIAEVGPRIVAFAKCHCQWQVESHIAILINHRAGHTTNQMYIPDQEAILELAKRIL